MYMYIVNVLSDVTTQESKIFASLIGIEPKLNVEFIFLLELSIK